MQTQCALLTDFLILFMRHLQAYASAMKQHEAEGLPAPPLTVGFTYELCAGIIDKNKSLQQIAAEEVRHHPQPSPSLEMFSCSSLWHVSVLSALPSTVWCVPIFGQCAFVTAFSPQTIA